MDYRPQDAPSLVMQTEARDLQPPAPVGGTSAVIEARIILSPIGCLVNSNQFGAAASDVGYGAKDEPSGGFETSSPKVRQRSDAFSKYCPPRGSNPNVSCSALFPAR